MVFGVGWHELYILFVALDFGNQISVLPSNSYVTLILKILRHTLNFSFFICKIETIIQTS